jgi:hypothetical protein
LPGTEIKTPPTLAAKVLQELGSHGGENVRKKEKVDKITG